MTTQELCNLVLEWVETSPRTTEDICALARFAGVRTAYIVSSGHPMTIASSIAHDAEANHHTDDLIDAIEMWRARETTP